MNDDVMYEKIQEIAEINKTVGKTTHEILKNINSDFHVSMEQFQLLSALKKYPNINQKRLAKILKVTPATLSVRINRLEKAKLLTRITNEKDKRHYQLFITEEGYELIRESEAFIKECILYMFKDVTIEEMESIKSCLNKVLNNLNKKKEELCVKD